MKEAQELSALAKEKGIKTVVGLQGRVSPFVQRIKSVVEEGRIGKILSSSITACGGSSTRDSLPERLGYFTQKSVGGNMVTIGFGHRKFPDSCAFLVLAKVVLLDEKSVGFCQCAMSQGILIPRLSSNWSWC